MNIDDLFKTLSFGELSGLSISDEGSGTIKTEKQSSIVYYASQALTGLYSKFPHKIDYVILEQFADVTRYTLETKHAVSDTSGNALNRHIKDTAEDPFLGDVLRILSVRAFDDLGVLQDQDLLMNDILDQPYLRTLSYKSLKFETVTAGKRFLIQVQQNHPKLSIPVDPTEEIILAPILEEALSYKVAARVFHSMNGESNVMKGSRLDAQYEAILASVTREDMLQVNLAGNKDQFKLSGFV
jgi:hypothetical protein